MPVTNNWKNIADITPVAADVLENNLVFAKFVNRGYDDRFKENGGKIGDTANVRVPGFYSVRHGKVADPQGVNDTYVPVTLTQHGVDIKIGTAEQRLNLDDLMKNVLEPAMVPLANYIDSTLADLSLLVPNYTGTLGTAPTDLSSILDATARLADAAAPIDNNRSAILSPWSQASMVNGLKTLYNPIKDISRQYSEGNMGELAAGCKFSMSQNTLIHTVGTIGTSTPLVKTTGVADATTIAIKGWASGAATLNKGDIIEFAGCNSVNPVTKRDTGKRRQFVVTETTTSVGVDMDTLPIYPAMILTGPLQNITALPVANAAVYVWGANSAAASAKSSPINLVFHRDAFILATADLPDVSEMVPCSRVRNKRLNMAFRLYKYLNGNTDDVLYRFDVLFGVTAFRKDFAVRAQG